MSKNISVTDDPTRIKEVSDDPTRTQEAKDDDDQGRPEIGGPKTITERVSPPGAKKAVWKTIG